MHIICIVLQWLALSPHLEKAPGSVPGFSPWIGPRKLLIILMEATQNADSQALMMWNNNLFTVLMAIKLQGKEMAGTMIFLPVTGSYMNM